MGGVSKKEAEKVRMLGEQYERLQRAWSENAMLFHDMGNHLQTIFHLAQAGENEEICRYISRISKPVEQLGSIYFTGVGVVDAVLNAKKQLAEERGYEMDVNAQLPANTGISEDDFCTVLTNLLDNAIESMDREKAGRAAMEKGEQGMGEFERAYPPIEVSLRHIHHFLVVRVTNPCTEERPQGRGFFATSKRDRSRHGWGVKSVQKAVRKYNGSLTLEVKDGKFAVSALLFFGDK